MCDCEENRENVCFALCLKTVAVPLSSSSSLCLVFIGFIFAFCGCKSIPINLSFERLRKNGGGYIDYRLSDLDLLLVNKGNVKLNPKITKSKNLGSSFLENIKVQKRYFNFPDKVSLMYQPNS